MSRLPLRIRLTAAFAVAMALVLTGAALFVYLRLSADLNESVDSALAAKAAAVARSGAVAAGASGDSEESFAQLVSRRGTVLDTTGPREVPLHRAELARVAGGARLRVERRVQGLEAMARVLAVPASEAAAVVIVGQSLGDRDETLNGLVASFAIGGPVAVVLASLLGYALAAAGLHPVEAIRRRAARVSLEHDGEPLPLPRARDEVRRLAETLNEMLDRLRRSYEREARFVADASHELRTPVAVIKTELEAALRGGPDPPVREALVAAVEECDHLAQLAEDLLVVARTAEGGVPVRPGPIAADALLGGVREQFADRAAERGRAIEVEVDGDVRLHADELRLRQALGNLVDNALRYGDGTIVLRCAPDGSDGGVALDVADEGAGFPPALAGRAFERFARGDVARTRGGTGLGLAIVRAIAEAHGGRADIVAGGSGATVRIHLPAAIGASAASKPALLHSPRQPTTAGGDTE